MDDKNISDLLQRLTQKKSDNDTKICKVLSVDGHLCDCEPIDGTADVLDVRLQTSSASGALIVPAIDSFVIIEFINKTQAYVAMCSEVEEIIFLGGDNGGVVKVSDLVDKLNNLENDLNTLKNIMTTWVPVLGDGGTALKSLITTWAADTLTPTTESELENDKFKH
jgi:hypothetical protein